MVASFLLLGSWDKSFLMIYPGLVYSTENPGSKLTWTKGLAVAVQEEGRRDRIGQSSV